MTKINTNCIVQELNSNCDNKDHAHGEKWNTDDIDIDHLYSHRSYCLRSYSHHSLCDSCSKILSKYRELHAVIINSAFETFNKVLELNYTQNQNNPEC